MAKPSRSLDPITPAGTPIKVTDETRPTKSLSGDPKNARRHTSKQISDISASISRFGYVNKITIRPDGQIIGGHATWEAVKQLGRDSIECRVVSGLTESGYRALALALNKLPENSTWDDDALREVLADLHDSDEDFDGLGFSTNELDKLLGEPEGGGLAYKANRVPAAVAELTGLRQGVVGLARSADVVIDRAIAGLARRMNCEIVKRWQADGKTGAAVKYIGVLLRCRS